MKVSSCEFQLPEKKTITRMGTLETDDKGGSTLDVLLSSSYCRSQDRLSRHLSQLHPELTMPMFSEITHRFQTARPDVRQLLLEYLLPWLHNMELVDPNVPPGNPLSYFQYSSNESRSNMKREGWGSVEATEMVLNNLFYITAKFADEHAKEVEQVWATLSSCWPNNLKVIIRYLIIISGMAPNELLQYAKRVVVYLARAQTDRLLDEMMIELHTVETLSWLIERTETPPFYRLTNVRKASNHSDPGQPEPREQTTERGTIHTKRHSGEDPAKMTCKSDTLVRYGFTPPRGADKIRTASGPAGGLLEEIMNPHMDCETNGCDENLRYDIPQPHPLPMPEYGGYFAPLTEYLPDTLQPSTGFHRCNVAVMLLADVVLDAPQIDWAIHLPLMLHGCFLGLDHSRQLVTSHCKQLLLNLLVILAGHSDHLAIAQILLNRKTSQLGLGLTTPAIAVVEHNFTEVDPDFDSYLQGPVAQPPGSASPMPPPTTGGDQGSTPPVIVVPEEPISWSQPSPNMPLCDVVKSLIDFIASRQNQVLWNYEDITAKVWSVRSVEQMDIFLQHVLRIFRESLPRALISERWGQIALQLGLSCSSRHYAGRSLQIFRSLHLPITSRMLSEILSRLVETVAEQGEDMQGYVTELLLTLEAAVDSLESDFRPLDCMKEIFKSTPNLNNKEGGKRGPGLPGICPLANNHMRSTSYSVSYSMRRANMDNKIDLRCLTVLSEVEGGGSSCSGGGGRCSPRYYTNLVRSRSAQSLRLLGDSAATQDDKMTLLSQLFWLSLSLLQSDYEHEFLLALRLLDRLLHRLPLDRPDARDKVDKLQSQLKWTNFPGLHALLLKGCTNSMTYEPVIGILSQITPLLHLPVVDPTQNLAFPMTVIALLPYMLLHYEDANPLCIISAENIAQVSNEKGKKLENLGTVMTLYSRRTFSKESFQWTKCVVKYLYDTYAHLSTNMLTFLVEVLEKGPTIVQLPVLSIIHCMLHYVDLTSPAAQPLFADLLKVISKYIEGSHWKEALKVLKLVVSRSSTLVAPPLTSHHTHWEPSPHLSFTDVELFTKKELPGRTMDFTFDVTKTPLIGLKAKTRVKEENEDTSTSPRRSVSLSPADSLTVPGWKRPWISQGRVRESLVNLLTACGQRVGLPKSPSVIFSQSSEVMERQSSVASSTEEVSGPDLSAGSQNPDHFGVFKDFDFLEYESESVEGESTDNFNWGVRRRVLSEGDGELDPALRMLEESLSETTPVLSTRKPYGGSEGVEESSDDEVGSESPLDELPPGEFVPSSPGCQAYTALSLSLRDRSNSTTHSDTSSSVGDLGELTPCNASPNLSGVMAFRPIARQDSEEAWRVHIQSLVSHLPTSPLHIFHLLHRVVKEVINKSVSLSREACQLLSDYDGLASPLGSLGDLLACLQDPPLVWFSPDRVVSHTLSDTLRFGMLELREHLDTFLDRKDQASECIENMKVTQKLQESPDMCVILETGRSLYKLHFQLVLLLEAANKMYSVLTTTAQDNKLQDVSADIITMRKNLMKATPEEATEGEAIALPESDSLVQLLVESKWSTALAVAKANRGTLTNDVISTAAEDDDITNILNVYCCHLVKEIPDVFILTEQDLGEIVSSLMQGLYQVLGAVNNIEAKVRASDRHK